MRKACKTLEVKNQNFQSNLRHISLLEQELSSSSPLRNHVEKIWSNKNKWPILYEDWRETIAIRYDGNTILVLHSKYLK